VTPATASVATQFVGAINPNPVDDVVSVFGDDVEQVEDHDRVRAVPANLQLAARVHVHHGGAQPRTALNAEQFEERADILRPRPRPIHSTRLRVGSTITVA